MGKFNNCDKLLSVKDQNLLKDEIWEYLKNYRMQDIKSITYDLLRHICDEYLLALHDSVKDSSGFSNDAKQIRNKVFKENIDG